MKSGQALFSLVLLSSLGCVAQTQGVAASQTQQAVSSAPASTVPASSTAALGPRRHARQIRTRQSQTPRRNKVRRRRTRRPAVAHKQQVLDLLERSHAANDEVLPDQRANLLARQISMISRLNSETGEKWAQELFQLGDDQGDDQKRAHMQTMAIQMVSQGDPEFGLKLLHQIKPVAETDASVPGFRQPDQPRLRPRFSRDSRGEGRIATAAIAAGSFAARRRKPVSV